MVDLSCCPAPPVEMEVVPGFPNIPEGKQYLVKSSVNGGSRDNRRQSKLNTIIFYRKVGSI
jgi:hypothetical protein